MRKIYADVGQCRALLVDSNPNLRSMQAMMLRDMGVGTVTQASKPADARRILESTPYDIVLCEYHFSNSNVTGQDLLDELRRTNQLPHSTVFIMVTGEAAYATVAEAAEAALDSYLLKPHNAIALEERLMQARHRKVSLQEIFDALDAGAYATAAKICRVRFQAKGNYWLQAARIGAELCVRLGQHAEAREFYEAVHATKAVPWARLGLARADTDAGQVAQATKTLSSLIADQPTYADAYDLMGRVQMDQGEFGAALETCRIATRITPNNVARLQKHGQLAFYLGDKAEAIQTLERSVRHGLDSKAFDCQSLMLLALLHFDQRDNRAFERNHDLLMALQQKRPDDVRLRRHIAASDVFRSLTARKIAECVGHVRHLAKDSVADDFDFESASNLLAVLARLCGSEIQLPESDAWVTRVARRFCVTRASTDLLSRIVSAHPPHEELVRAGHTYVGTLAEEAMAYNRAGAPERALQGLINMAQETKSTKLVDLAGKLLARHAETLKGAAEFTGALDELRTRFGMTLEKSAVPSH